MTGPVRPGGAARPRGATAVVVAILVAVLAGFTAVVVNVGHMMAVRGQLQNATDAAALAGARSLDGSAAGIAAARAAAEDYAARHETDRAEPVVVGDGDVVLGHWNADLPAADAFTPIVDTSSSALGMTNAVLVRAGREAARGNPLQVFLDGLLGRKTVDVRASAIAVRGGPCDEGCAIPIVFAECQVLRADGSLRCDEPLVFNSDGTDNIGFTNLSPDPTVSTSVVRQILQGDCRAVSKGDVVGVSNGANLNPVISLFAALVGTRVSAPIVDLGACPVRFNEHPNGAPIVGFASFTILNVVGGATKAIYVSLDCNQVSDFPAGAGCTFYGTVVPEPRLVR